MAISSGNAILNQYIPDMCIKNPVESQTLLYDSVTNSFKNKTITAADLGLIAPDGLLWENTYSPGDIVTISDNLLTFKSIPKSEFGGPGGGASRLNDLTDVSIIAPIGLNEVLTYDFINERWTNSPVSYDNLTDIPTAFTPDTHTHTESEITDLDKYTQAEVDALLLTKSNLVIGAVPGNLAGLDANGDTTDSGIDPTLLVQQGNNISLLINDAGYMVEGTSVLNDLLDVDTTGVTAGQVLKWNGSTWLPSDDLNIQFVTSVFGRTGDIVATNGDYTATQITYDNSTSGLTAIVVQNAIDELNGNINTTNARIDDLELDTHTHSNKAIIDLITDAGSGSIITDQERIDLNSALQPGNNISLLINDVGYIIDITNESIGSLLDVDITGITSDQILVWNGTEFIPKDPGAKTFEELADTPTDYVGQGGKMVVVKLDETGLVYQDVPTTPPGTIISMDFGTFTAPNARMDAGGF